MIAIIKLNCILFRPLKYYFKSLTIMNKLSILVVLLVLFSSCGDKKKDGQDFSKPTTEDAATTSDPSSYDPKRGIGKFDKVDLAATLDHAMADAGQKVAEVKCTSCHKPTEEKLVGPGWKGVTTRRTPQWIMNFATNPDPMIDKDPEVQAQLEICLVRMPNQGLKDDEARSILEYMRKIDGVK